MRQNQEQTDQMKEVYEKPQVEIIEMETDGNYLLSASGGYAPGYNPGGGR